MRTIPGVHRRIAKVRGNPATRSGSVRDRWIGTSKPSGSGDIVARAEAAGEAEKRQRELADGEADREREDDRDEALHRVAALRDHHAEGGDDDAGDADGLRDRSGERSDELRERSLPGHAGAGGEGVGSDAREDRSDRGGDEEARVADQVASGLGGHGVLRERVDEVGLDWQVKGRSAGRPSAEADRRLRAADRRRRAGRSSGGSAPAAGGGFFGARTTVEDAPFGAADLDGVAGAAVLFVGPAAKAALDLDERALADVVEDLLGGRAEKHDPMPVGVLVELVVLPFPALRGGHVEASDGGAGARFAGLRVSADVPDDVDAVLGLHGDFVLSAGLSRPGSKKGPTIFELAVEIARTPLGSMSAGGSRKSAPGAAGSREE